MTLMRTYLLQTEPHTTEPTRALVQLKPVRERRPPGRIKRKLEDSIRMELQEVPL
jgi:hypothetical protein